MLYSFPSIVFLLVVSTLFGFIFLCLKKTGQHKLGGTCMLIWLIGTGLLSFSGFFTHFNTLPPRILFAVLPMILLLIYVAKSQKVHSLIQDIPHQWLIHIQAFRVAIEIVFWLLATQGIIPEIMTWHGRNFDILAGVTAPFIAYLCFTANKWNKKVALVWNGVGILLLVNVFGNGLLSAPTPFQVFATNIPNTFVGYFPYTWLPTFIVPCAVLFHILSIKKILNEA